MTDLPSIVVPWRDSGDEWRSRAFNFCRAHYERNNFVITTGDFPSKEFNRSASRNAGAELAIDNGADVLAFIDADAFIPDTRQLVWAAEIARRTGRMIKPFTTAGFLTEKSTEHLYATNSVIEEWINPPTDNFIGLGWVISARSFLRMGGFDEQFVGYGGEDNAFHAACALLLGPVEFVNGPAYSLFHPGEQRISSPETWERTRKYWALKNELEYWSFRGAT